MNAAKRGRGGTPTLAWLGQVAIRNRRPTIVLLQMLLVVAANYGAFLLRFDGAIPDWASEMLLRALPWLVAVRCLTFVPFGLYAGLWRYTSIWDLRNIVAGVTISSCIFAVVVQSFFTFSQGDLGPVRYPRSIQFIDALLLVCFLGGIRLIHRVYREMWRGGGKKTVLIYGAGDAGEMIVRDMRQNAEFDATPLGFIDDDDHKVGRRIHGLPVLGTRRQLAEVIRATQAQEVLIAIPSAPRHALREIVRVLEPFKVRISTLPRMSHLVGKQVGVGQIRELKVEDLLARDPITLDYGPVREVLTGKRVLVSGAGGSIGSELCRQIADTCPGALILLDRYENTLYEVHNELKDAYPALRLQPVIADITDERRVDQVFASFGPQVIFHAAAHKHVPLMEENPCEAIKNNVGGTRIVAQAAQRWGAERFVMVSTDKAVNPTSVMGAAKRVAELVVKALDQAGGTRFIVVRFGNVLGSNGSVVPRFLDQIAGGGPVTVTHPDMRRYFMLIPEAVQLVLHAAAINEPRAIFVLDMGEQVRVSDLARDLIRLSGFVPDKEIEIVYTGVRPGEKLYEELVNESEEAVPSPISKIMKVTDRAPAMAEGKLERLIASLERAAIEGHEQLVLDNLLDIVPDFQHGRTPSLKA